jgi:hypothetical protein
MPGTKKNRHKRTPSNPRGAGAPITVGGKQVSIYLDQVSLETAARLGDGNASQGVREALRLAQTQHP